MEASISRFGADGPSDARQVRSRKALSDALLALLEEKPFDQLTIREISARAGIGYATFFRHYPDKESLLSDVASEEITDLLARASPLLLGIDSLEPAHALCTHVAEHRALWSALLTGGAAGTRIVEQRARRFAVGRYPFQQDIKRAPAAQADIDPRAAHAVVQPLRLAVRQHFRRVKGDVALDAVAREIAAGIRAVEQHLRAGAARGAAFHAVKGGERRRSPGRQGLRQCRPYIVAPAEKRPVGPIDRVVGQVFHVSVPVTGPGRAWACPPRAR